MSKLRFGLKQEKKPTPKWIGITISITIRASAGVISWIATSNWLGPKTANITTGILGLLIIIGDTIKPYFGEDVSADDGKVP